LGYETHANGVEEEEEEEEREGAICFVFRVLVVPLAMGC
jgi:hypothetical protein